MHMLKDYWKVFQLRDSWMSFVLFFIIKIKYHKFIQKYYNHWASHIGEKYFQKIILYIFCKFSIFIRLPNSTKLDCLTGRQTNVLWCHQIARDFSPDVASGGPALHTMPIDPTSLTHPIHVASPPRIRSVSCPSPQATPSAPSMNPSTRFFPNKVDHKP